MRERITVWKDKAVAFWQGANPNQKLMVAGAVLLVLISLGMGVWAATSSTDMVALYTDLEQDDAAGIAAKLKEMRISYELADGGTTIMVPPEVKDQARLDLAAAGWPKGIAGFESLGETRFGETTRDKEVRYILALQSELANTIKQLKGIEQSWVYLTVPREALFTSEQEARTASVIVKLAPAAELQPEQVMGVVHLVSRSVEGLKPENVTVVDSNGRVLSEDLPGSDPLQQGSRLSMKQLDIQKQFEKDLGQSIQSMLEKVLGFNKSVVRVRAELDFDQQEIVQTQWGPNKFPRSTENTEEITTSQNSPTAEAVGTPSNIPGNPTYPETAAENNSFSQQKTSSVVNNEIDKLETHRIVAPGKVNLLNVAVMVDSGGVQVEENTIREAVSRAAGINTERGDQVSVSMVKFDTSYWDMLQEQARAEERKAQIYKWSLVGGVLLALLLTAFIVYQFVRRRREPVLDTTIGEPIPLEELLSVEEMLSPEEKERAKLRETIEQLAREKPEDVAQLVRTWLTEDMR